MTGRRTSVRNLGRTREKILAAALAEFSARGFAGARVDAIAGRARVNKRMLYYCFGAKQDLYREILRRKIGQRAGFIESTPDDFAGALAHIYLSGGADIDFVRLMEWEAIDSGGRKCIAEAERRALFEKAVARLRALQRRGSIPRGVNLTQLFISMLSLALFPLVMPQTDPSHPRHGTYRPALHASAREFPALAWRSFGEDQQRLFGFSLGAGAIQLAPSQTAVHRRPPIQKARSTRMKKRIVLLVVVLMLGAGAWAAYSLLFKHGGPTDSLLVSGDIEAHESVLSFKTVQSRIVELPFDEGQWVKAGTLLARLEDRDYRQQVVVDQAALLVQQRQLALALRNLEAAKRTVASDQADLWEKTIDYQRAQELWQNNAAPTQTRDLAETALKQSRAVLERDQALQAAAEESITVAQANIKNAQESLTLAKIILGYTTLYAPFSGVILVRNAELGEDMQPGTPVFTLADLDHVWLRAYVNETDIGRVRFGQAALITTDSYPGHKYVGRISMISENAEFTPKSVRPTLGA